MHKGLGRERSFQSRLYPCGINDLKNANRKEARLEPNVVPRTPSTELFVEYVRKVFPDFDETTFFVPEVTAIPA